MSIVKMHKSIYAKKRKGFTLVEIMIALAIVIALSVAAFFAFNQAQIMRRAAQANNDMDAIVNAMLAYESLNAAGSLPSVTTGTGLLTAALTADQAIDGKAHTKFLTSTKAGVDAKGTGTLMSPWNTDYTISIANRTVTVTNGDTSAVITRAF